MEPRFIWDPTSPHPLPFQDGSWPLTPLSLSRDQYLPEGAWTQVPEGLGLGLWVLPPESQGRAPGTCEALCEFHKSPCPREPDIKWQMQRTMTG